MAHKNSKQTSDARENPTAPIVGVGAVVIKNSHVLLIRRGKPPKEGEWSLPGGKQKLGETTSEAARREILEETGVEIEILCLLDVVDFIDKAKDGSLRFHYTLVDFLARPKGGELKSGSDALEARFFPLEEALQLPLWKETRRIIAMAAEKVISTNESETV
ncbi:MAG: NUDIX hydrolase [Alphaproteobacteria bacterium]|nr:NUDIX hydrolase [Alphaproteobacteria bacterium]